MSRKEFSFLLQQYLEGKCSEDEKAFVEHWYGLIQTKHAESVQETDMKALEPLIWQQIRDRTLAKMPEANVVPMPVSPERQRFAYGWLSGIAAAVVLVLLMGWWFYSESINKTRPVAAELREQKGWRTQTNSTKQPMLIELTDGSIVRLAPHSSVQYPQQFAATKREVRLVGEAFFNVQKMPSKPFLVYTGQVVTRVLGTSFFVKAQADAKQISVEVVTGRVAVYKRTNDTHKAASQVVLTPNQKTIYSIDNQQFTTGLVEQPQQIASAKSDENALSFQFEDTPLRQVLDRLEKVYGIQIIVENPDQNNCPLTADLTSFPLFAQLDMICAATKSTYTVEGTSIHIRGKGCQNL
ncbi:FecR family protein [Spirosoma sp. KNUC1025]|uniref:FecR family protein n=1 Tax=Spirosoma sp. KNUC1025 TaxID=2894082 RepID=UPI00386D55C1|nr:FecR domain-containing protein [Spirosoma sp. KNUC1025]